MNRIILCISLLLSIAGGAEASCPIRLFPRFARSVSEPPAPARAAVPRRMPYVDEAITLRLKFQEGQDFYVEMTTLT